MRILHYMLRLLLVFVCLFVLFSHSLTVCAADSSEETSTFFGTEYPLSITNPFISTYADVDGYSYGTMFIDFNGDQINFSGSVLDLTDPEVYRYGIEDGRLVLLYFITLPDVLPKGEVVDLNLNINHSNGDLEFGYVNCADSNWNTLSNSYTVKESSPSSTNSRFTISDLTSKNGITKYLYCYFYFSPDSTISEFATDIASITIEEVSSKGLLSSIIDFLKSIWEGITNLPTNIANSIKGFFDNIVNSVVNLGNTILDGIKSLFIPSEEDITNMKDKWDILLSDRFGALYQVVSLISDYAASFKEQSKNTITFPSISIPLAGATFEFGGWEVQVVPDGFGIIFDTLKMITSILATMLFINGLKNRFDKIMGGADDI